MIGTHVSGTIARIEADFKIILVSPDDLRDDFVLALLEMLGVQGCFT
ncbi:MAG: hypothetical protein JWM95_3797 [Gemmatimonadetes bacterium]|nr:hypothetical protein [Gemmatimonadota bacterium]